MVNWQISRRDFPIWVNRNLGGQGSASPCFRSIPKPDINQGFECRGRREVRILGNFAARCRIASRLPATSRRILLRRFSVRGHRSEIMLGVLVVVLRANDIAGLGLILG